MHTFRIRWAIWWLVCLLFIFGIVDHRFTNGQDVPPKANAPWPMFGGTPERNMANIIDKNILTDWSVAEGKEKNVKWAADLGSRSFGGPVIAGGRVFVGTNNAMTRDPGFKNKDGAVLMAFDEANGKFLWQIVHDVPKEEIFSVFGNHGIISTPTVDGHRLYYVTPFCEIICADTVSGDILWRYDMRMELKVVPLHCCICSPLVGGERLFVITGNARDEEGKIASPQAPSIIALDKKNGRLLWQNNMPGDNILESQWTSPAMATMAGKEQIIFPGGDGVLYGLEPASGKMIWKCQCNPGKRAVAEFARKETLNYFIGTPVVYENKVYIGMGVYPDHPNAPRASHVLCLDITKTGDVSPVSLNARAPENKKSALVWAYGGMIEPRPKKGRQELFGPTMSTPTIYDGLVYIGENYGYLHCLDAKTGQQYWEYDLRSVVWGSPYYVDGKVYQGTEDGTIFIFEAGKTLKLISTIDMEDSIHGTPVVANGILYIATQMKLFALAAKK
jgi:outer membrane protein assembly factor BamB